MSGFIAKDAGVRLLKVPSAFINNHTIKEQQTDRRRRRRRRLSSSLAPVSSTEKKE